MIPRFATISDIENQLMVCGFDSVSTNVPTEAIIQSADYFDHTSLRRQAFRDGDSHFSLLTDEELKAVLTKLDLLEAQDTLQAYIATRDRLRREVGQFTYIVAQKCSASICRRQPH
jgi:hypothetical protein